MPAIWIIAKREINSFFDSLMAYILIVVFLGLSGFFTWLYGNDIFLRGQASLDAFFGISFWSLFFFIPAITMKTLAEENKTGTIELLITKSVSDWQIVTGKFLACLVLVAIALVCTLPYYVTVSKLGNIDHASVWGGYFAMTLMSASYISIGLFTSSTTNNQIISFLLALFIGLFFQILFDVISNNMTGTTGAVFDYLSLRNHFDSISRGVIDSKDLIYFFSLITGGLILSEAMLSKRNWK